MTLHGFSPSGAGASMQRTTALLAQLVRTCLIRVLLTSVGSISMVTTIIQRCAYLQAALHKMLPLQVQRTCCRLVRRRLLVRFCRTERCCASAACRAPLQRSALSSHEQASWLRRAITYCCIAPSVNIKTEALTSNCRVTAVAFAFSASGGQGSALRLVSAAADRCARVWDARACKCLRAARGLPADPSAAAVARRGPCPGY